MRFDRLLVVGFLALSFVASACEQSPDELSRSPLAPSYSLTGSITATPNVVLFGNVVALSWTTESSSVRIEACQEQCVVLINGGPTGSVFHQPPAIGEWRYRLLGVVAEPDVLVRLGQKTVNVLNVLQEAP